MKKSLNYGIVNFTHTPRDADIDLAANFAARENIHRETVSPYPTAAPEIDARATKRLLKRRPNRVVF